MIKLKESCRLPRWFNGLYLATFILAFCSIVYEFILAQALTAFLENTLLRYSVTMGLYMCCMGLGALVAEGKFARRPILTLIKVELFLAIAGGSCVIFLFFVDWFTPSRFIFSLCAHGLIILIGFLTGLELPLLIALNDIPKKGSQNKILAVNYAGAVCGTIIFAFIFYPRVGLISSSFAVAILNILSGFLLLSQGDIFSKDEKQRFGFLWAVQVTVFVIFIVAFFYGCQINDYLIEHYLT